MNNNEAKAVNVVNVTVSSASEVVKPLTDKELGHIMIDLDLDTGELVEKLKLRGLPVTRAYVALLLAGKRKGLKPYGKLVVAALSEELGVPMERFKAYLETDEADGD